MDYFYLLFRPVWQRCKLMRYQRCVRAVGALESSLTSLSDADLDERIRDLHSRAQGMGRIDKVVPLALALGREMSRRRLGMRHYDVQLIGTLALYEGYIAEMDTGEGKTLMAPLAAFLHRLGRMDRCTHVVTANEYLAHRDAEWMGPLCEGLGLSVGLIVPGQALSDRAAAYRNDIVYATAKEVVFDSLREPVRKRTTSAVETILRPQRQVGLEPSHDFAIVDEVDSVLIDQSRSPLAIGAASGVSPQLALYQRADEISGALMRGEHYRLLHDDRKVELKDEGKAESRRQAGAALGMLPPGHQWDRYLTCALAARHLYKRDEHYVVRHGRIVLIDESTGRLLPGRQLQDGIHQALEIRNKIVPSVEMRGSYQTTFQTFFRRYGKLAGMTGTASIAGREFMSVYNLAVLAIPSNKPSHRSMLPDMVYRSSKSKYNAVMEQIRQVHRSGRPLLIATGSVGISEKVSDMLAEAGLEHEVLNAKNHAREAEIIAQAGSEGRITVITNMAGRGVDIVLGEHVAGKGGIFLLGTDRLHYRRLDDQLSGRVGRQGDPGQCQFFLSLKDDLLRYVDRKKVCRLRMKTRKARGGVIQSKAAARLFEKVQRHIAAVSTKQRHKMYRSEKHREDLKEKGMWEDWMDIR